MIKPEDQMLNFTTHPGNSSAVLTRNDYGDSDQGFGLYVTYLNAQSWPISDPVINLHCNGAVLTVGAHFPLWQVCHERVVPRGS